MPCSHSTIIRLTVSLGLVLTGTVRAAEKATVRDGGQVSASTLLTSGVPAPFSVGATGSFTFFNGDSGFRIVVPSGATSLEVRLLTTTPNVDVDLYIRFGTDVVISDGQLVAHYLSEGFTGEETITVTGSSAPPLAAGTYYIALGVYSFTGNVSGTITATINGTAPPPSSAVEVTPGALDFGNVTPGQTKDLQATIRNGTAAGVMITSISSSNPRFTLASPAVPFSLAAGAQQAATIRFAPLAIGVQTGTLTISTSDPTRPTLTVSLQGTGAPAAVEVTPTTLDFGTVTPGQTKDLQVAVRNGTAQSVNITSLSSSNGRFTVISPATPFTLAAAAQQAVTIRFSPLAVGLETGVLTVSTSDASRPTLTVSLQGTGASGAGGGGGVIGGPVAWWKFDEGSGAIAADSSGNNNTGVLFNEPPWTTGKVGGALSFDGVNDYVGGSNAGVNFPVGASPRTISAWIKTSGPGANDRNIFHYGTDDVSTAAYFQLFVRGDGKPAVGNTLTFGQVAGASRIDDDNWHHVVGVYEGAVSNRARIFVDGVQSASGILAKLPNTGTGSNWRIGRFMNGGGPFRGLIDDVRLYDRVLFELEIRTLFAEGGGSIGRPTIRVSSFLDFGTAIVGRTVDSTLAIRNIGSATLTVSSISISQSAFRVISPSIPFNVAPSAEQAVVLRFQPNAGGEQTAVLTIVSNDAVRPAVTADLIGIGQPPAPPAIGVSRAGGLIFELEAGLNMASQTFTVSNTGGGTLDFQVTANQSWLSASPSQGTSGDSPVTITASVNVAGLNPGSYEGEIRISAQSPVAPVLMPVRVVVTPLPGAPVIPVGGIVNAASFTPSGFPGGAIARGSIFSIFGTLLGPANLVAVSTFPLQTILAGVSVKVTRGSASADAIPLAVSATQMNAIMPSNAPLGEVSVAVTFNGRTSLAATTRVVDSSFGIFAVNQNGMGPGILQNFISQTDQPLNSPALSARPGQFVTLWGTGLGPITGPDNIAPPAGDLPFPIEILVGGKRVTNKTYSGRAPCCAGLDQIVFEVPADAPEGCFVPALVRSGVTSNAVTMAIEGQGRPCVDPANPLSKSIVRGGKEGLISLRRISVRTPSTNGSTDLATASFTEDRPAFDPFSSLPPIGSCTVFTGRGVDVNGVLGGQLPGLPATSNTLDAGVPLIVIGPSGTRNILRSTDGRGGYFSLLGGTSLTSGSSALPLFLDPGPYMVMGPGGSDVGPFTANLTVPPLLTWINRDQLGAVDRRLGATLLWSGGDPPREVATILGWSTGSAGNTAAVFLCVAPPAAGGFTVPATILETLPPNDPGPSSGFLFLGTMPSSDTATFTATGVDSGLAFFRSLNGTACAYR